MCSRSTTAASRSPGSASRTFSIALIPPAEPTIATTSTGGASTSATALQQDCTHGLALLERLAREQLESLGRRVGAAPPRALGDPGAHVRPLEQGAERHPEGRVETLGLCGHRLLGGKRVPDAAAVADEIAVVLLPEDPAARWTAERGRR